jgi:hypothetical protein
MRQVGARDGFGDLSTNGASLSTNGPSLGGLSLSVVIARLRVRLLDHW